MLRAEPLLLKPLPCRTPNKDTRSNLSITEGPNSNAFGLLPHLARQSQRFALPNIETHRGGALTGFLSDWSRVTFTRCVVSEHGRKVCRSCGARAKQSLMVIRQSKLSPQQLDELQRSTHFDRKELQQWYKGMRSCDALVCQRPLTKRRLLEGLS